MRRTDDSLALDACPDNEHYPKWVQLVTPNLPFLHRGPQGEFNVTLYR